MVDVVNLLKGSFAFLHNLCTLGQQERRLSSLGLTPVYVIQQVPPRHLPPEALRSYGLAVSNQATGLRCPSGSGSTDMPAHLPARVGGAENSIGQVPPGPLLVAMAVVADSRAGGCRPEAWPVSAGRGGDRSLGCSGWSVGHLRSGRGADVPRVRIPRGRFAHHGD